MDSSEKEMHGACPRCNFSFATPELKTAYENSEVAIRCPRCQWAFTTYVFRKHAERLSVRLAWPGHPERQILLSDEGHSSFRHRWARIQWRQKVLTVLGDSRTKDQVMLRRISHILLYDCVRLCDRYPAIPASMNGPGGLRGFYRDVRDLYLVGAIADAASDADYMVTNFMKKGRLSHGEMRHILETDTLGIDRPRSVRGINFAPPHFRGLVLATLLWDTHGGIIANPTAGVPQLIRNMLGWMFSDFNFANEVKDVPLGWFPPPE